jgi:hypothetical protein
VREVAFSFRGATALLLAGAAAILAMVAYPLQAQAQSDSRTAYNAAFQVTLQKPSDPAALLNYAQLAIEVGDYEGAISAYERVLIVDADQPRVKIELAILYYRLGSWEAARAYFEDARNSAKATPEIKARAAEYITDIDRRSGTSRFSGDLLVGTRYSDNANLATNAGVISSFGVNTVQNPVGTAQPDWAAIAAAQIRHRYDFGHQDNGTMETDFNAYTARQFQVTQANVTLLSLATGPRFEPFNDTWRGFSLKPFVIGSYLAVQDYTTYWLFGTGMEAVTPINDKTKLTFRVLGDRREYVDNPVTPINNVSTGNDATGTVELRAQLTKQLVFLLGGNFTRYIAVIAPQSYTAEGFAGSLTWRFDDPIGINGRTWYATGSVGMEFWGYDQPDPTANAFTTRSQTDLNLGFVLGVPLDDRFTVLGQVSYTQRNSNISNYAYNALSTLVGLGFHF